MGGTNNKGFGARLMAAIDRQATLVSIGDWRVRETCMSFWPVRMLQSCRMNDLL